LIIYVKIVLTENFRMTNFEAVEGS